MLRDAEHLKSKIGGLDGAGDTGDYVINLVKGKNVPKSKPPVARSTPVDTGVKDEKDGLVTNGKTSGDLPSESTAAGSEKGKESERLSELEAAQKAA